jgi:cyclic-di-GMP phosphodiesterase TipF (flagellum assembly factor)
MVSAAKRQPATAEGSRTVSENAALPGGERFRGLSRDSIADVISKAVDANRIDLYLQPIVTLPQRKVRYYEAVSRLRTEDGDIVPAGDFIDIAESVGLMPKIDNLAIFRCVQVTRRLLLKSRDVGLFCNVSAASLTDALMFRQFLDFMDANRALASSLMFEFPQEAYRNFGPIEDESLAALAERGFRFSMDHVTDLHMEPNELANRSFRFLKVPARLLLLNKTGSNQSHIDPEDLSDLLARSGIDLIAERIETETTVVDLLDYDVRFGQGFLFSPPRPVRAEALQGNVDALKTGASESSGALLGAG